MLAGDNEFEGVEGWGGKAHRACVDRLELGLGNSAGYLMSMSMLGNTDYASDDVEGIKSDMWA